MAFVLALAVMAGPAEAHRPPRSGEPPAAGVVVPSLTHGQMAVIASNLAAIRDLAASQNVKDLTLWRLEDYLNLQSFACLWGLVPGAIADETSPFNECAHGYLAAGRAILLHLRDMPGADRAAVSTLIAKVEREMLENDASLVLCRYSDEPFHTDQIVWPHWTGIPFHPPTFTAFAFALAAFAAAAWGLWPRRAAAAQAATIAE